MTTTLDRPKCERRGAGYLWQEEEDDFLRKHYPSPMLMEDIAQELGRTPHAVKSRASVLGLIRQVTDVSWSLEEVTFLRRHYHTLSIQSIADALGRTHSAVYGKAVDLGLTGNHIIVNFAKMWRFKVISDLMEQCAHLDGSCSRCSLAKDCNNLWRRYMAPSHGLYHDIPEEKFPCALEEFAELFSARCVIARHHEVEEESLRARIRSAEGVTIYRCED